MNSSTSALKNFEWILTKIFLLCNIFINILTLFTVTYFRNIGKYCSKVGALDEEKQDTSGEKIDRIKEREMNRKSAIRNKEIEI